MSDAVFVARCRPFVAKKTKSNAPFFKKFVDMVSIGKRFKKYAKKGLQLRLESGIVYFVTIHAYTGGGQIEQNRTDAASAGGGV
jgi:hypothetical protein